MKAPPWERLFIGPEITTITVGSNKAILLKKKKKKEEEEDDGRGRVWRRCSDDDTAGGCIADICSMGDGSCSASFSMSAHRLSGGFDLHLRLPLSGLQLILNFVILYVHICNGITFLCYIIWGC